MADERFARIPDGPYYAVIFSSRLTADTHDYGAMSERMVALAQQQPGFLGVESARDASGFGITVSYWESEAAITGWRNDAEHRIARETGRTRWYEHYELRVAKIERAYRRK